MKKILVSLLGLSAFSAIPLFAGAQACSTTTGDLSAVLCTIGNLLNFVVPVLIALGVVYFIWGVVSYVIGTDEEAKAAGRSKMIYGLIGLVVIVSIWGLVSILKTTFNLQNQTNGPVIPCIPLPPATSC